jgi:hypothetical protein
LNIGYGGRNRVFDAARIRTYPLSERPSRVDVSNLVFPDEAMAGADDLPGEALNALDLTAAAVADARKRGRPVVWIGGAHFIKANLAPLVADMIERGFLTLWGGNGAAAIHDFEFSLVGRTSESVPNALRDGKFGFADETGRMMNECISEAYRRRIGLGEALGMAMAGELFQGWERHFGYRENSLLYRAFRAGVPATIHVTIGADIIDQHAGFDPAAKGFASGVDFLVFAAEIERMGRTGGGVLLNVGSAVTGPEVTLKAVSMAANVGAPPTGIFCADFDMRAAGKHVENENMQQYYYRDIKSVVSRIPASFGGVGVYVQGDIRRTIPALYRRIRKLEGC